MTFVLRVYKTYPQMFKQGRPPPFIHSSQLGDGLRLPLLTCSRVLDLLKGSDARDSQAAYNEISDEIIALLAEVSPPCSNPIPLTAKGGLV